MSQKLTVGLKKTYWEINRKTKRSRLTVAYCLKGLCASAASRAASLPAPRVRPRKWVALDAIRWFGDSREWPRVGVNWTIDGEWDRELIQCRPSIFDTCSVTNKKWMIHETVRNLFIDGLDYRETPQYRWMMDRVAHAPPEPNWGCWSPEEVHHYFENLLTVFQSMKANGYLDQTQLDPSGVKKANDDIPVYVTRNGELCQGNAGNHRIKMAEILGIEKVPVILWGLHTTWVVRLANSYQMPPRESVVRWMAETDF